MHQPVLSAASPARTPWFAVLRLGPLQSVVDCRWSGRWWPDRSARGETNLRRSRPYQPADPAYAAPGWRHAAHDAAFDRSAPLAAAPGRRRHQRRRHDRPGAAPRIRSAARRRTHLGQRVHPRHSGQRLDRDARCHRGAPRDDAARNRRHSPHRPAAASLASRRGRLGRRHDSCGFSQRTLGRGHASSRCRKPRPRRSTATNTRRRSSIFPKRIGWPPATGC